jgi:Flp pilus assembly protein TadD
MKSFTSLLLLTGLALVLSACETAKPAGAEQGSATEGSSSKTATNNPSRQPSEAAKTAPTAPKPSTDATKSPSTPQSSPSTPVASKAPEPAPEAPQSKAEQLLAEGTALYEKGDYKGAIRKLTAAKDAAEETSVTKQNSLRLLAFSYCVTSQRALCKAQFTSLVKLDPAFELSRAEAGHPLWGPAFKEVKAASVVKPSAKK